MTTYSKVKQTFLDLKSAKATFEQYALLSGEGNARSFQEIAERLEPVLQRLDQRIQSMEFEEPQYRGS
ncbi:flagellar biosynthesis/type III secretory pathway chaperone [Kroppenstedtia sanguinis]|uniref:DUF1657 domain-containing protein n=1 Tax=Kroppenstedtia sanguinis TaxID=1380684 RepID=A0ABW4C3N1_9BACL